MFLHFIALICTWLNAKFHAKYTLKQVQGNKFLVQNSAKIGYFIASYLTPILLIPLYNKHFLKNKGIIKSINGEAKKIIQVPKKYLTPDGDLKKGLKETAERLKLNDKNVFNEIYERYNNPDKLKKDLLSVHEKILMTDFITTGAMWSAIPWIATEFTEYRTKRTDFSAGFNLKNDNNKPQSKTKKLLWNIAFSVLPGVIFAKTVTKGLSTKIKSPSLEGGAKSLISRWGNSILQKIAKNPHNFDYASGTNMSKTIYAAIWVLSSFPAKLISARDENERKDRALRDIGLFTMFFGGDFAINNISGRIADKIFGTRIIDPKTHNIRNFRTLENIKDLSPEVLAKTKNIGAGLYWFSLIANTALIGFGLPKLLNKFLRYNINKEENKLNK